MSDAQDPGKKGPRPAKKGTRKKKRGRAPRPDEMTRETFEFVAAIDEFKRDQGKAHLVPAEVLEVLRSLGYSKSGRKREAVKEYQAALATYRKAHGRLFPNWSEVFSVVQEMGYRRKGEAA